MWLPAGSNTCLVSGISESMNKWYHIVNVILYCQENHFLRKQTETMQLSLILQSYIYLQRKNMCK